MPNKRSRNLENKWKAIGRIAEVVTIVGLIVAVIALWQDRLSSKEQGIQQSEEITTLRELLDVVSQSGTLQASLGGFGPTATYVAQQNQGLAATVVALTTQESSLRSRYPYSLYFSLNANAQWVKPGIFINRGERISIQRQSGEWRTTHDTEWKDGFDCSSNSCGLACIFPDAPEESLIARVGNGNRWCAGRSTFTSSESGDLSLSFNDAPNTFSDNEGQITVLITITR